MDLAWITAMLDQPAEARRLIDRAMALAPGDAYVHYYDGLIWNRAGDPQAATKAFGKAIAEGYSIDMLAADPQLAALRADTGFRSILAAAEAK